MDNGRIGKSKGQGTNGKKKGVKEIAKGRTTHQYLQVSIIGVKG